jgi:hypothetical protein
MSARRPPSEGHRPALGMSDCERIRGGVLSQPVNASTSLAYAAAAAGMIVPAKRCGGLHRVVLILYAASLAAVGVGSVAYHGPQPRWARRVHDGSVAASLACTLLVGVTAQPPLLTRIRGQLPPVLSLAALAGAAYRAGRSRSRWCNPASLVQLHGMWHLLSAASALSLAWILGTTADSPDRQPRGVAQSGKFGTSFQ